MKAVIHTQYGAPQVARVVDIETPQIKDNEILIKVHTATVNRTDSGFRSAEYFISRFWSGLFRPKKQTLGCEFAGAVEKIGSQVTNFQIGDRVFGFDDEKFGAHAEYLAIAANKAISIIPENLNFDQAAALTEGAHYALCNIKASKIKQGQNALVYGATGAIGSAAVQLLNYMGVNVTAVCNTKNVELVKSIGAKRVIDYQKENFQLIDNKFHLIFDAVGKSSFSNCKHLLTSKGIYVSTELGKNAQNVFLALFTPIFKAKKVIFPIPIIKIEEVEYIKNLAEQGKFNAIIDRTYKIEQIVEAYTYVETGQKTGNVLLKIAD